MKFQDVSNQWLTEKVLDVEYITFEMYNNKVKSLLVFFAEKDIKDITAKEIQSYLNDLYLTKNFAKSTISKYKITMSQIYKYAILHNIHTSNPVDIVKIPKKALVKKVTSAPSTTIDVIIQKKDNEFGFFPFFIYLTGLRVSEALAVQWEDIDLDINVIKVSKAVRFKGNNPVISNGLKNGDRYRFIPIPDMLVSELQQKKYKDGLLFKNEIGTPLTKSQFSKRWKKYITLNEIQISPHQLRHNHASNLYNAGVDPKSAQKILGHRDITVTLKTYTDLSYEFERINIDKYNNFINKKFNNENYK
ncbi:MAG: tyrosine-type recombinase/integrase [Oscillospiraceae bacterium]